VLGPKDLLKELILSVNSGAYTADEAAGAILRLLSDKTLVAMPRKATRDMLVKMNDWPYGSGAISSTEEVYDLAVKSVHG
jgi:hypothetical protein